MFDEFRHPIPGRHPVLDTGLGFPMAQKISQAPCQARGDEVAVEIVA